MAATDKLKALLAPVIEDLGYEFVGVEYHANPKNRLVRIYIDQGDEGIGVEDCERVSREVSALMDVEEPVPGQYTLEVSSPGVERPLFEAEHFQRFAGEVARVMLHAPQDGRRKFKGSIVRADENSVVLLVDGVEHELPLDAIRRAELAPDLDALFAGDAG
ncbi:ribosome maturation factor RimP [Wenzhouxiangella sp. AB-CW3]|uniref:ribosome maturation factor RimP n=1 Tax=Wenzhouxiangella sp. AB-CW3 TaxID=2771012 RepID=UPI00168AD7DB|nr:ribosome maturation factor RimP [Wenzhouxiangella sp. AB-CW3]QOC21691.1 ribosome maturation factor RimP [Wenzhouxiangella sp. AB-CW3]